LGEQTLDLVVVSGVCHDVVVEHHKNESCANLMGKTANYSYWARLDAYDWINRYDIMDIMSERLLRYNFMQLFPNWEKKWQRK
jgi:hypothetical protein